MLPDVHRLSSHTDPVRAQMKYVAYDDVTDHPPPQASVTSQLFSVINLLQYTLAVFFSTSSALLQAHEPVDHRDLKAAHDEEVMMILRRSQPCRPHRNPRTSFSTAPTLWGYDLGALANDGQFDQDLYRRRPKVKWLFDSPVLTKHFDSGAPPDPTPLCPLVGKQH